MPKDLEGLEHPNKLVEFRKIKTGEKPGKIPSKTPIRIRLPLRDWKAKRFPMDEAYMRAEAVRQNLPDPEKSWTKLQELEVATFSNVVEGDNGVVFLERALYTGRGRLCGSRAREEQARQSVDVGAYARNKTVTMLPKPRDVECTPNCPLWPEPGKKSDCKWRCIATFQLPYMPVYPAPARFRSTGINTIKALLTSLRFISNATEGVLMGIPLWLTQSLLDTHDAAGELRRIPIVHIEFKGRIQELRAHAVRELESRNRLKAAADGVIFEEEPIKFVDDEQLQQHESVIELASAEDVDGDDAEDKEIAKAEKQTELELQSQIALFYNQLEWTPARQRLLEEKHAGNLSAVLHELQALCPQFNPSPGEPGPAEEQPPEGEVVEADDEALYDDLFDE